VVFTFKPPTFEDTFHNTAPLTGNKDVRYWSLCTSSIWTTTSTCIVDDEVVTDSATDDDTVTVVVGPASLKEKVQAAAGLNFLQYSLAYPLLFHRHILPAPNFNGSASKVPLFNVDKGAVYTEEYFESVRASNIIGAYCPIGQVFTHSEFDDWLDEHNRL